MPCMDQNRPIISKFGVQPRLFWGSGVLALLILILLIALSGLRRTPQRNEASTFAGSKTTIGNGAHNVGDAEPRIVRPGPRVAATPEEIVTRKLAQFGRSRRALAYGLAHRHNIEMSGDVERFFDAVESGNWDEIKAAFDKINGGEPNAGGSERRSPEVSQLWPAIIDAYGVAEQVHLWPAQKLLDYGNAVLGALRPGMVYVGGTDNGRWVPELMNETGDGERHIVITQNGLAAGDYLDYLRFQYDDQMANLSEEDSQRSFQNYIADAQKRLEHDQQHPDEPKQILSGENVQILDGKVQVSGQVAVMAINEKLLQTLMQKNPDLSFAIEESFPLKGTYADALPLGPLMELNGRSGQNDFSPERATEFVDYWRNASQQILVDSEATASETVLRAYSHDTAAAANLLASHQFSAAAEEAYRLSAQLWPQNPESIGGLANLLASTGRQSEAQRLLDDFARNYPGQIKDLERVRASSSVTWTTPLSKP
jgi:hypothetical protein